MYPAFLPSLQHMASVTIAAILYRDLDIHHKLYISQKQGSSSVGANRREIETWHEIKRTVLKKIPSTIPVMLQRAVVDLLRPIDLVFEQWITDHCNALMYAYYETYVPLVRMRSDGTIDKNETAARFIQCPGYALGRFLMACNYCRPEDVVATWKEVEDKDIPRGDGSIVVRFWQKWRRRQQRKRRPIPWRQHFDAHFLSSEIESFDNPMRICCFFDTLSDESKSQCIELLGTKAAHEDDVRQYLYRLDEEEQKKFMQSKPAIVLRSLLKWPFQEGFMEVANQLWNHMTADDFASILHDIATDYIKKDLVYDDFLRLFRTFWHKSPDSLKKGVRKLPVFPLVKALLDYNARTHPQSLPEIVEMNSLNTRIF